MQRVLTSCIWDRVSEFVKGKQVIAAIAYVTDLGKLKLKRGDVLVCDASDERVKSGATDRDLIAKLYRKGIQIISLSGLHAKCAVFGRYAVVGSSNLSVNGTSVLKEMALMTDDCIVREKVSAQIQNWADVGHEIGRVELKHMMSLPRPKPIVVKRSCKRIPTVSEDPRFWVVWAYDVDYSDAVEEVFHRIKARAEKRKGSFRVRQESVLQRFTSKGDSAFDRTSRPGDFMLQIADGKVYPYVIVLDGRTEGERCFYLAPVNGLRCRTLKQFDLAIGSSRRKSVYQDGCCRLIKKEHLKSLPKLWDGLSVD